MKRFAASIFLLGTTVCWLVSVSRAGAADEPASPPVEPPRPVRMAPEGIRAPQVDLSGLSAEVRLKNGAVVVGGIIAETDGEMTLVTRQSGGSRPVTIHKTDISEVIDHLAERRLIVDTTTKARIERDIAAARAEVADSQKDIARSEKALDDLVRQRQSNADAANQNPELIRQQTRLRLDLKGSKVAEAFVQARVTALQDELHRVDDRIAELKKRSWKAK